MRRRELLLLIWFAMPACAGRPEKFDRKQCAAIDRRIKRLESRLRQGHSARQGRALKRRARELQLRRFHHCR